MFAGFDLYCSKVCKSFTAIIIIIIYVNCFIFQGNKTTAELDGKQLFSKDFAGQTKNGFAVLGTGQFGLADFDKLVIKPA